MSTVLLSASMNALSGTLKGVVQREAARAEAGDDGRILVCGTCRMLVGTPHAGERSDLHPLQRRVVVAMIRREREQRFADEDLGIG